MLKSPPSGVAQVSLAERPHCEVKVCFNNVFSGLILPNTIVVVINEHQVSAHYTYTPIKLVASLISLGERQHRAELHDRGVECGQDREGFSVGVESSEEVWDGRNVDGAFPYKQAEQRQHEKPLRDCRPP